MATPGPPPGWYSDPGRLGAERFWDGQRWTMQRSAANTGFVPPRPPSAPPNGYAPRPGAGSKVSPKVVLIGATVVVLAIVAVVLIVTTSKSGSRNDASIGTGSHNITGTQDDWVEAVCQTGTFMDGLGGLPGAKASAYCRARTTNAAINISQFDSDYKMRNAIAMLHIKYYVSGIEPDGTVIVFSAPGGGRSASDLEPLTQFGFTITTAPPTG